jgi:multicomponent Na+:H+ antiporter subunit G
MNELLAILLNVKPVLGAALCFTGGVLALIGTIGVLRFPDFYTRLHAASVTDTSALTIAIIGMALMAPSWLIVFKLAAIWAFFFLTGPTSSHALANAAHTAGVEPLIGERARSRGRGSSS